jgi:hypothetical protein
VARRATFSDGSSSKQIHHKSHLLNPFVIPSITTGKPMKTTRDNQACPIDKPGVKRARISKDEGIMRYQFNHNTGKPIRYDSYATDSHGINIMPVLQP